MWMFRHQYYSLNYQPKDFNVLSPNPRFGRQIKPRFCVLKSLEHPFFWGVANLRVEIPTVVWWHRNEHLLTYVRTYLLIICLLTDHSSFHFPLAWQYSSWISYNYNYYYYHYHYHCHCHCHFLWDKHDQVQFENTSIAQVNLWKQALYAMLYLFASTALATHGALTIFTNSLIWFIE